MGKFLEATEGEVTFWEGGNELCDAAEGQGLDLVGSMGGDLFEVRSGRLVLFRSGEANCYRSRWKIRIEDLAG